MFASVFLPILMLHTICRLVCGLCSLPSFSSPFPSRFPFPRYAGVSSVFILPSLLLPLHSLCPRRNTSLYLLSFLAESSQSPRGLSHSRLLLFLHIHASLFSAFTRGDTSASRAHRMSAPPRPGIAVRSVLGGYGPRHDFRSTSTATGRTRLAPRLTAAAAQLLQTSLSVLGSQGSAGSRLLECFARPRRFVHLLVVLRRAGCTSSSSLLTKILLHHSSLHPPHSISAFTFPSTALPVWIKSMLRCLSRRAPCSRVLRATCPSVPLSPPSFHAWLCSEPPASPRLAPREGRLARHLASWSLPTFLPVGSV